MEKKTPQSYLDNKREYYLKNRERILATNTRSRQRPEAIRHHKEYNKKYYDAHLDELKVASKKYRDINREKIKFSLIKRTYGISKEVYEDMLKKQRNSCAVCFYKFDLSRRKEIHVDDCHKSKQVRGLLCNRCNRSIGLFSDDATLLKSAIKYLEQYS